DTCSSQSVIVERPPCVAESLYVDRHVSLFFFFQAEDGIRDRNVTGVQTCALPILFDRTRVADLAAFTQDGFKRMVAFLQSENGQAEWRLPGGYRLVKVYDTAYILPGGRSDFLASAGSTGKMTEQVLSWQDWVAVSDQVKFGWFVEDQADVYLHQGSVLLAEV